MVFFNHEPGGKKITPLEFRKIKENLRGTHYWSPSMVDKFEDVFSGHMKEKGMQSGIDREEANLALDRLRENGHAHGFSEHHYEALKGELEKHFKD